MSIANRLLQAIILAKGTHSVRSATGCGNFEFGLWVHCVGAIPNYRRASGAGWNLFFTVVTERRAVLSVATAQGLLGGVIAPLLPRTASRRWSTKLRISKITTQMG